MKKTIVSMMMVFGLFGFSQAVVLDDAVTWMYTNGLTIFKTTTDYQPNNYIRRDEAAKLFVKFAKIVKKDTYKYTAEQCKFSDLNDAHSDLKDIVVESCRLGIFQGANGKFMPRGGLTNEQAVTVLVRILVGNQSEKNVSYWSENYYKKANELGAQGMLSQVNMTDRKLAATRGNVGILLAQNSDSVYLYGPEVIDTNVDQFVDNISKVIFEYPSSIDLNNEKVASEPMIVLQKDGITFGVFHNGSNPPARGAFWGDSAKSISSTTYINNFCKNNVNISNCVLKNNRNSIPYVKYFYSYGEMGSDVLSTAEAYIMFNPNPDSQYPRIMLSTETIGKGFGGVLQDIMESISLVD